jgi:hypothetical protein
MTMSTGGSIAEHLSVGLLARSYPIEKIRSILERSGLQSQRVRDLPAEALVYYVIALGLFMAVSTGEVLRSLVEGLQWLGGGDGLKVAGKAAISQARSRIGAIPLRMLWEETSQLMGQPEQPGCFYRGLRLMAMDGSVLDVPDTAQNLAHFGRQKASRGKAAFPQLHFVSLCECGPHAITAVTMAPLREAEIVLAEKLIRFLQPGMLCLADRLYGSYRLWQMAAGSGADLLWRSRHNAILPPEKLLSDNSYLSTIYPSELARRHRDQGIVVRVIDYTIEGLEKAEPLYRLITTLLDPEQAPAKELAKLYTQRWEMEGVLDELKTHLRGGQVVLRSKTPALVEQEFYGLMLAHRAVRALMNDAALREKLDTDRLSFTHTINIVRRKLASMPAFSPS